MNWNDFYLTLPRPVQNLAVSGYGYYWRRRRYGGIFESEYRSCREREAYSEAEWQDYQNRQLSKLLLHAFDTVPYYQSRFTKSGLSRDQLSRITTDTLDRLPILEKQTLRELGTGELLSSQRERGGQFYTSSGSTGTPVKILYSYAMHQRWRAAFEARIYNWAGVTHQDPRGMIGGRVIIGGGDKARAPFYRYNFAERQVYFSIYHISKQNAWSYLEGIRKYKPAFMTGYAASNYLLASFFEEENCEVEPQKAVITSSEKLTGEMRALLGRVYRSPVFDSWSGIEACGLISQDSDGLLYVSPDVGILEALDEQLKPVKSGEVGALYCTGLMNFDQPLIRYKIGDLVRIAAPDHARRRGFPVVSEIVGRIDDVIWLPDGRTFSSFNRFFADINGIKEVQVEQMEDYSLTLRIVPSMMYSNSTASEIVNSVAGRLGKIDVRIDLVENIPRGINGKFKAVLSHAKRPG